MVRKSVASQWTLLIQWLVVVQVLPHQHHLLHHRLQLRHLLQRLDHPIMSSPLAVATSRQSRYKALMATHVCPNVMHQEIAQQMCPLAPPTHHSASLRIKVVTSIARSRAQTGVARKGPNARNPQAHQQAFACTRAALDQAQAQVPHHLPLERIMKSLLV